MIVDSSAIVAIILSESSGEALREALVLAQTVSVPAPVLTEIQLVLGARSPAIAALAEDLLSLLIDLGAEIAPFTHHHAEITRTAREAYGKGNGKGGTLNFGDLMVYAIAKQRGEPLLCTGSDFAATDLELHPASRLTP